MREKSPLLLRRHVLISALLATLPLGAASCSSNRTVGIDSGIRTIDASGAEFVREYDFPRSILNHADYLGRKDGYHYLAVYQPDVGSTAKLQFYLRTRDDQLPASFPDHPQKPTQATLTTQQAAEMMKPRGPDNGK